MATWKVQGIDEYIGKLEKLSSQSEEHIKRAIYPGAGLMADAIKASAQSIPTRDPKKFYRDTLAPGPTPEEKSSMIAAIGIAKMRKQGSMITAKVGVDGYSSHKTKSFPGGVPNAVIARSVEAGTSWMKKTPFISRAVRQTKPAAEAAIKRQLDEEISKLMN